MAFVGEPFRHDIFVSYSHGDVRGDGQSLLKQWSQGFADQLRRELELDPEFGKKIKIFMDQDQRPGQGVDPMAPLTEGLKTELAVSAILAVLMTPHYLGSLWCKQEREWWVEAQSKLRLAHQRRIAVARVWPTEEPTWPAEFVDSSGHPYVGQTFFDKSKASECPRPYSWPSVNNETTGPFRQNLVEFVGTICRHLRELKGELDECRMREEVRARLAKPDGQVIYLHGRKVHESVWERVHHELEDDGYIVFPVQPEEIESDPSKIQKARNERVTTMSGCDAVLVLGTDDVLALNADLVVIGRDDRTLAIAQSSRILPCGVVDTVGVVRQTPDWSRKAKRLDVSWFDASIPPWTPQIRTWLNGAAS